MKTFNVKYILEDDGSEVLPGIPPSESMLPRPDEYVSSRPPNGNPEFRRVINVLHDYTCDCHSVIVVLEARPYSAFAELVKD